VLAVEMVDPREAELPAVGHLAVIDPETVARMDVDTSSLRVRRRSRSSSAKRREAVARELQRLRVDHVALSTDEEWLPALGRHLR
jgi:hypothetical protein